MTNPGKKEVQNNSILNDLIKEAIPHGFNKAGEITTEETAKYILEETISKNLTLKGFEAGRTFKSLGILAGRVGRIFDILDLYKLNLSHSEEPFYH